MSGLLQPASDQSIILEDLLSDGVHSFSELVAKGNGRFPTEILEYLETLSATDTRFAHVAKSMIEEARRSSARKLHPQGDRLALPHPLDAEWRFNDETAKDLVQRALDATGAGDSILLLGVPTVVLEAARSGANRIFLVKGDSNVIADGVRKAVAGDLRFKFDFSVDPIAAAAVLDPPWYVDQFVEMLSLAAACCRREAKIFASAAARDVRPEITADWVRIGTNAEGVGLELKKIDKNVLIYRTPLFELNALFASGVNAWLPDWRRGNLATYVKQGASTETPKAARARSFEVTVEGIRLRLVLDTHNNRGEFLPLSEGEVFPSVSRRAPDRGKANLWTTGNRAFIAPTEKTLTAMLELAHSRDLLPKRLNPELLELRNRYSIDEVKPLIQKLTELAERELAEAEAIVGSAAWDRKANDARFLND